MGGPLGEKMNFNTFSITARCQRTGELGVAVSTKFIAVGMLCSFVKNNVGAIASQAYINPYLGIMGLEYLAKGHSAQETLQYLRSRDGGFESDTTQPLAKRLVLALRADEILSPLMQVLPTPDAETGGFRLRFQQSERTGRLPFINLL